MTRQADQQPGTEVIPCARCGVQLRPGAGDHYRVTVEAVADPAGPVVDEVPPAAGLRRQIKQTLARLAALSEREALEQVHRRLVFHLCGPCYRRWIENPAG